jgi:hypothetical protein
MSKQAISVSLEVDNLTWLRGRARAAGGVSVSGLLDRLIEHARTKGSGGAPTRSVVGTLQISASDPELRTADEAVRKLFGISLGRSAGRARPRPRREPRTRG